MKEKEIFEQFLNVTKIPKEDVIDYRYCTEFYAGVYIQDAIIIQLVKGKYDFDHLVYKANTTDENTIKTKSLAIEQIIINRDNKTIDEGTMGFHDYVSHKEDFGKFVKRVSKTANELKDKKVLNINYPTEDIAIICCEKIY